MNCQRGRCRGKQAIKTFEGREDEEKEKSEERQRKLRIIRILEEESDKVAEDDPEIAMEELKILGRFRKMLKELEEEDEVLQAKIVSPKEVSANWSAWREAVESEVQSLIEDKEAMRELSEEELQQLTEEAQRKGKRIEIIPSKVVFTRKPGKNGGKKKARWAICGNHEEKKEDEQTYS